MISGVLQLLFGRHANGDLCLYIDTINTKHGVVEKCPGCIIGLNCTFHTGRSVIEISGKSVLISTSWYTNPQQISTALLSFEDGLKCTFYDITLQI